MDEKTTASKPRFEMHRPPSALQTGDGRAPLLEDDGPKKDAHELQKQAVRRNYAQTAQRAEPISTSFEEPIPSSPTQLQSDKPLLSPGTDKYDERATPRVTDKLSESAHERQKRALRMEYTQRAQVIETTPDAGESTGSGENIAPNAASDAPRPHLVTEGHGERVGTSATDGLPESAHERQKRALRMAYVQKAQVTEAAPDAGKVVGSGESIAPNAEADVPLPPPVTDDRGEHAASPTTDDLPESAHERQKRKLRMDYMQAKQTEETAPGTEENASVGENNTSAAERKTGKLRFDDEQPRSSTLRHEEDVPAVERLIAENDEMSRIKVPQSKSTGAQGKPSQSSKPEAPDKTAGLGKLRFEKDRPKKPSALRQAASATVREAFREHADAETDDNAGLDAANMGERAVGSLARSMRNHAIQKHRIRTGYALAKSGRDSAFVTPTVQQAVYTPAERASRRFASSVPQMRGKAMVLLLLALMLFFMMNSLSSCAPLVEAGLQAIVMGTYPSEEADILATENAYCAMEDALADELDHYAELHPEFTAVEVTRMDIWHDPYVLIALVCARFDGGEWTIDSAMPFLEQLFHAQYEVTVEVNEGVASVTMTNKNLSHLPFHVISHSQVGIYALYMSTLGNMPDLFAGNPHASVLKEPMLYDVPEETLAADPNFAALIGEAEKYIGYPYVWGGSEPDTSFDCSGFISWIFTETGVCNIGRLGATGLYNACEEITPEEAHPGDLIFFTGTLGEGEDGDDGITHVGLYVGDGMMLHCGNPISYADLSRTYWQEHFYGYGRLY